MSEEKDNNQPGTLTDTVPPEHLRAVANHIAAQVGFGAATPDETISQIMFRSGQQSVVQALWRFADESKKQGGEPSGGSGDVSPASEQGGDR